MTLIFTFKISAFRRRDEQIWLCGWVHNYLFIKIPLFVPISKRLLNITQPSQWRRKGNDTEFFYFGS